MKFCQEMRDGDENVVKKGWKPWRWCRPLKKGRDGRKDLRCGYGEISQRSLESGYGELPQKSLAMACASQRSSKVSA